MKTCKYFGAVDNCGGVTWKNFLHIFGAIKFMRFLYGENFFGFEHKFLKFS